MAVSYRYYRLRDLAIPDTGWLEISEFQLTRAGARVAGATLSASDAPYANPLSWFDDGHTNNRCYWQASVAEAAGFWVQWDFGVATEIDGVRFAGFDTATRYPESFSVYGSNDGASWTRLVQVTGATYPGNQTYSAVYPVSAPVTYTPAAAPLRLAVSDTYTPSAAPLRLVVSQAPVAPVRITVSDTYTPAAAPLRLTVVDYPVYAPAAAPVRLTVSSTYAPPPAPLALTAVRVYRPMPAPVRLSVARRYTPLPVPLSITVTWPTYRPAPAPLRLAVSGTYRPAAPVEMRVHGRYVTRCREVVRVGGVDVSDRLTGETWIEAEEGAARVAELTLYLPAGPVSPGAYTGAPVEIDLIADYDGVEVPARLFTGLVDLPAVALARRTITLRCTDDLARRVAALDRSAIDALIPSAYHPLVQGEQDDPWEYAQARLRCAQGGVDCDAYGVPRFVPWAPAAHPLAYVDDDILDATLVELDLGERSAVTNTVRATLEWRFARLFGRRMQATFHFPEEIITTYMLVPPRQAEIVEAAAQHGWHYESGAYTYAKTQYRRGDGLVIFILHLDCVIQARVVARRHHAQTVTQRYVLEVSAPDSVAANGVLSEEISAAWASEWDSAAWEAAWADGQPTPTGWAAPAGATPCDEVAPPENFEPILDPPGIGVVHLDHAPDAPDRQAMLRALLAEAEARIQGSHRATDVRCSTLIQPALDTRHAVTLTAQGVTAAGKVRRFRHTLDPEAGSYTTEITLAVRGVGAAGLATPTPLDPPEAPAPDTTPLDGEALRPGWGVHVGGLDTSAPWDPLWGGHVANYTEGLDTSYCETGFRFAFPGVDEDYRQPIEERIPADYTLAIPADPFTLSLS